MYVLNNIVLTINKNDKITKVERKAKEKTFFIPLLNYWNKTSKANSNLIMLCHLIILNNLRKVVFYFSNLAITQ